MLRETVAFRCLGETVEFGCIDIVKSAHCQPASLYLGGAMEGRDGNVTARAGGRAGRGGEGGEGDVRGGGGCTELQLGIEEGGIQDLSEVLFVAEQLLLAQAAKQRQPAHHMHCLVAILVWTSLLARTHPHPSNST